MSNDYGIEIVGGGPLQDYLLQHIRNAQKSLNESEMVQVIVLSDPEEKQLWAIVMKGCRYLDMEYFTRRAETVFQEFLESKRKREKKVLEVLAAEGLKPAVLEQTTNLGNESN